LDAVGGSIEFLTLDIKLRLELADKQMAEAGGKNADGRLQQRLNQLQEDFLKQKE